MTDALVERGVELAQRENTLTWDWARWALEVTGPIGERGSSNGAKAKLERVRDEVANTTAAVFEVPAVKTLMDYRVAAEMIPPDHPFALRLSVYSARALAGLEPFERDQILATFNGDRITAEGIRERIAELRAAEDVQQEIDLPNEPESSDEVDQENGSWITARAHQIETGASDSDFEMQLEDEGVIRKRAEPGPKPKFNQVNDNIGWARWSWNPVTGCLHNCEYCYARDIANRFYAEGFAPTFRPERLMAPQFTKVPETARESPEWRRVFTCSMADLFGKWVSKAWIDAVFEQIVAAPQWEFLCLTKFPQRLAQLEWPDNVWAGTTVDKQHRVKLAQKHFAGVKAGVKWLSCEPLLEPLKFDSLEMFDWVVIGACTESSGAPELAPEWDWVVDLYQQARNSGCKVYLKHNLFGSRGGVAPGMQSVREWPR